ncbi:MAG: hypothetical protein FWC78_09415 [Defluviitaleaceae bacterium]|nr:hypothetical protein [Defluviitaleaceae bacterium]
MKKLMDFVMPIKLIAGGILFGIIGFYMVVGSLYAHFTEAEFEYSIPFAFIVQGAVLAVAVALLWVILFGDTVIKKWRFFKRALVFNALLVALVAICFVTSIVLPLGWAHLWLVGTVVICLGISIMSGLNEIYCRRTGQRYNEMLRIFKEKSD